MLALGLALGAALPVAAEKADRDKPMNAEADALRYDDLKQTSVRLTPSIREKKGSFIKARILLLVSSSHCSHAACVLAADCREAPIKNPSRRTGCLGKPGC